MKKTLALMTVLSAFAAAPAFAADVEFSANVASSCTIDNVSNGTLTANVAVDQLASGGAGDGSFDVTANASIFNLSVSNPTGWGASPAATPATTFSASATIGTATATPGSDISVPNGSSSGTVALTADADTGTFPNGAYEATVVVTCS